MARAAAREKAITRSGCHAVVEPHRGGVAGPAGDHVDFVAGPRQSVGDVPRDVLDAAGARVEALDDQREAHAGSGS
jgi:hypothetical protein